MLGRCAAPARGPDDDFLTLAHVAAQDFRRRAVAQPERDGDRRGLSVRADHPDATGGAAARLARGSRHLVVTGLLLFGEDFADARALGFADLLRLRPALGVGKALKRAELLATTLEDRLELLLLLLGQAEPLDETLANLFGRGRSTARRTARRATRCRPGGRRRVDAGRSEPERRVRHLEGARLLSDDELDVGRHPGHQPSRRVLDAHDDRVGHDVLDHLRSLADLRHDARERLAGKRVDREACPILELEAADVRLVHARLDLHLRQVLGDREEDRRLQARRDGLADVDLPRHDDAVDRRQDRRVIEIDLRLLEAGVLLIDLRARRHQHGLGDAELRDRRLDGGIERLLVRLGRLDLGDGGVVAGLGRVEIAPGDEPPGEQLGLAVEVALGVDHRDLRLRGLGLRLGQRRPGVLDIGARPLDLGFLVEHGRAG